MKIHIIENDNYKESRNKTHLRLINNNLYNDVLREDEEKYNVDKYKNNINDKIMRQILKDKYQAAIYLNDWLKIKSNYEIKPEELEEVTESYITHNWSNKETDIVYKDKKYDGVFYLIEHQTKVDYLMAKRIGEYKNEIDYIASYIFERISKKIGKDVASLMIKNIEENFENEKEEKNMLEAFVDRFLEEGEKKAKKEIKEKIEKERKESISQIAINMLKEKCDKSLIKRCTGLSYAKINELEKRMQSA